MLTSKQFVAYLLLLIAVLYGLYLLLCVPDDQTDAQEEGFEPVLAPPPTADDGEGRPARRRGLQVEGFGSEPSAVPTAAPPPSLQGAIDFSDVTVSEKQRTEWAQQQANAQRIMSVNERFDAAKRKTEEHKLRPGVYTNRKRRQLIEAIVRRPFCGKRSRSWRTAFSDTLRGDVVPKQNASWNMMRVGRSDPTVDLHPGALGPLAGKSGLWVSEANVPDNAFDDLEDLP